MTMMRLGLEYDEDAEPVKDKDLFEVAQKTIDQCVNTDADFGKDIAGKNYYDVFPNNCYKFKFSCYSILAVFRLLLAQQELVEKLNVKIFNRQTNKSCKMDKLGNFDWSILPEDVQMYTYRELLITQSKIRVRDNNI